EPEPADSDSRQGQSRRHGGVGVKSGFQGGSPSSASIARTTMNGRFCILPLFLGIACISSVGCATTMQITSGNTIMCMNVVNHGSPEHGAAVIMRGCDPWQNQQWSFNGHGPITGVGGFCVDVQGSAPVDGAAVIYTPCSGSPSQTWTASNGTIVG